MRNRKRFPGDPPADKPINHFVGIMFMVIFAFSILWSLIIYPFTHHSRDHHGSNHNTPPGHNS